MKLYFCTDVPDDDETLESIQIALSSWIEESPENIKAAHQIDNEQGIGLGLTIKSRGALKAPLSFLNGLSKTHKIDFVVGIYGSGKRAEDVCYFGYEEGKPDANEIANYLGL